MEKINRRLCFSLLFLLHSSSPPVLAFTSTVTTTSPLRGRPLLLAGGPFDFLNSRAGQFIKVGSQDDLDTFGPPAILLHSFPLPLAEAQDIVADALDIEVEDIRDGGLAVAHLAPAAYGQKLSSVLAATEVSTSTVPPSATGYFQDAPGSSGSSPIVYFSGMPNEDVRAASRALVGQLYDRTGARGGIAKAVPPAMSKLVGDLLEEIEGDHEEALAHGQKQKR
uniref:Uncharacterized protein n=1 Tax=Octactis speculum TaxID=3111310 RepID=A0A7S2H346_9STRA|mmetsp:Transcript_60909/g.83642  ORF Transcript_60909/g.83642 Transcript_60909/m.83642 type:complete len:223 (+) Transcript_60909:3-671(+)